MLAVLKSKQPSFFYNKSHEKGREGKMLQVKNDLKETNAN